MNRLDDCYKMLLNVGFIVLREAMQSGSREWLNAELEMLHNVPSLIGESNGHRHRYYWLQERIAYMEWISTSGSDHAKSRMKTYYQPVWEEMSKEIDAMFGRSAGALSA